jgi:chromosomal replication initiator protein
MAILRREVANSNLVVADEVLHFIADRIKSNIRKLEGALIQVASYASLTKAPLTIPVVETILAGSLDGEIERCISIDEIQRRVAEFFDIRVADMKSSRRPKTIAFPRQIAMYLSRDLTGCSLTEIGEAFGGRDHTTVLHACRKIENNAARDPNLGGTLSHLGNRIRSGVGG